MAFGITEDDILESLAAMRDMPDEELEQVFGEQESELPDGHLVEYAEECVKYTERLEEKRMKRDEMLWDAHEGEMPELSLKDDWQAKLTTNEPFQTVMQAKMLVRRAIIDKPDFVDVTSHLGDDPAVKMKVNFWRDADRWWAEQTKLQELFPDMTEMSFSVGLSLAAKCVWGVDQYQREGMRWVRIEPWKIRRDPDTMTRDPQSGLYCVHQDWVDYHKLLQGEKDGHYINVANCLRDREDDGPWGRREERKKRGLVEYSNKFLKKVFVREVWGSVLDHNGELVLPNVRFTVANRTIIKRPVITKFPTLRWPIHQFAALPHMRNFHGYSLIEGMLKMWKFRNNLLCMTADKMNFVLNAGYEVDESKLVNPADKQLYPGCTKAKKAGATGAAYTPITTDKDFLPVIQKIMEMTGNLYQNGVFVTELVKGELGDRRNITKGEIEIKTEQAMGVFEGIGHDVEYGLEQMVAMMQEVLTTYWDPWDQPSYIQVLGRKHERILGMIHMMTPDQRIEAMRQETDIKVRGISLLLQKSALVDKLINMAKLTDTDRFRIYAKDYPLLKKIAAALDASDVILSEDELATLSARVAPGAGAPGAPGPVPPGAPGSEKAAAPAPGEHGRDLVTKAMAAAGVADPDAGGQP